MYRILETRLGAEMKEKVTSLSLSQNGDSAIFDIPTADKDTVRGKPLVHCGPDQPRIQSTGPLARPFARSLAPLTRLLAPDCSPRSPPPLRSLVRSLAHFLARGYLFCVFSVVAQRLRRKVLIGGAGGSTSFSPSLFTENGVRTSYPDVDYWLFDIAQVHSFPAS